MSASLKLMILLIIIIKMQQNDDVEERKEDNNILVKHLVKITNQQIVDLSVKNQAIEKRLQECSLNTTIFMNNNGNILMTNNDEIRLLLSTVYNDLKIAFSEFEKNNDIILDLKHRVTNLTRQNENCHIVEQGGINKSVMYKRATNCVTLNLTGIVLIEYENRNLDVYCENGWLLIQRRQHGYDINFNRTWIEYKNGFGSLRGEFWIGNEIIYGLTNSRNYRLRIELVDWNENFYVADYENFRVDSEKNFYQLHIQTESFSGNASRDYVDDLSYGLSAHNNAYFQTYDHSLHLNHSASKSSRKLRGNCALRTGGAWWVLNETLCLPVNLNGIYVAGASSPQTRGIKWLAMNNHDKNYSLKKSKMKIQPMD